MTLTDEEKKRVDRLREMSNYTLLEATEIVRKAKEAEPFNSFGPETFTPASGDGECK